MNVSGGPFSNLPPTKKKTNEKLTKFLQLQQTKHDNDEVDTLYDQDHDFHSTVVA